MIGSNKKILERNTKEYTEEEQKNMEKHFGVVR